MSVINSVLRDLESRRAAPADRDQLPDGLIAAGPTAKHAPSRKGRLLFWGLLLALSGALAYLIHNTDAVQTYSAYFRAPPPPLPKPLPVSNTPPAALAALATATAPVEPAQNETPAATPLVAPPPPPPAKPPKLAAVPRPDKTAAATAIVASEEKPSPRQAHRSAPATTAADASSPASARGESLKTVSPRQRAQALYNQAQQSLASGRSSPAKAILEEALGADPSFADARQLLASLQAESAQNDAAEATLAGGLAYAPPPPLILALARLRLARAGDEAGFRLLMEYQHTAKDSADYQAFLGTLLLQRKQWAEAGHRYANALRLNPRPGAWWAGYGLALFGTQQYSEAQNALTHAKQQGSLAPALLDVVNERLGDLKRLLADKEPA
jgi:Tfp pilus assembly protein PilF